MPRRGHTDTERLFQEDAEPQARRRSQITRYVERRLSYSDDEVAGRPLSGPGEISNQASDDRRGHRCNEYGEPQSPPPPYSEHDRHVGGRGRILPNERFSLYPGEGGRAVYITDSSGRRERYIENDHGERVPWPLPDHGDSSDDGDGDSEMVHLESGRIIPRSEWEADHEWHSSSDEPSSDNDTDGEFPKAIITRCLGRAHPDIGLQNTSYPIVRFQGYGVDIAPRSDGAADNVNQDGKGGPIIALESGLATRIAYQDSARAIISSSLVLIALPTERSTELKPILVGFDERERDRARSETKRRMRAPG